MGAFGEGQRWVLCACKEHDLGGGGGDGPSSFSKRFPRIWVSTEYPTQLGGGTNAHEESVQETAAILGLPSSTFNGIITRPKIAGSILRDDRFIVSAPNPTTTAGAAQLILW